MKKIFFIFFIFLFHYSFSQDCTAFQTGIFENENDFGKVIIERSGGFQLEKNLDGAVYLQKITKLSECEYSIKGYKVIALGNLPPPNIDDSAKVIINTVDGNKFYYNAKLIGTTLSIDGIFEKVSNEISAEFKKILSHENN